MQETINYHEERGFYACPDYQGAIGVWFQNYICRMRPWPDSLEKSFAAVGNEIYMEMIGPSDFNVIGNLKDWDSLRSQAAAAHNDRTASYLLGMPLLSDYLDEALAQFGHSAEEFERPQ